MIEGPSSYPRFRYGTLCRFWGQPERLRLKRDGQCVRIVTRDGGDPSYMIEQSD